MFTFFFAVQFPSLVLATGVWSLEPGAWSPRCIILPCLLNKYLYTCSARKPLPWFPLVTFGWYYWFLIQLPLTYVKCFLWGITWHCLSPGNRNPTRLPPPVRPYKCWMRVNYLMPVTQWLTRPDPFKCKLPSSPAGFWLGAWDLSWILNEDTNNTSDMGQGIRPDWTRLCWKTSKKKTIKKSNLSRFPLKFNLGYLSFEESNIESEVKTVNILYYFFWLFSLSSRIQ